MPKSYRDLTWALAWTCIGMITAIIPVLWSPLRVIFSLPLVVFLPGYLLFRALDSQSDRDVLELLMFSVGGSLALAVLVGFGLNWSPWGLHGPSMPLVLGLIALIGGSIARLQHHTMTTLPKFLIGWRLLMAMLLVFLTGGIALLIANIGVAAQPQAHFTQFWLAPSNNGSHQVHLGIVNHETSSQNYQVALFDRGHQIAVWDTIVLANGATWSQLLVVPANALLQANLYQYQHLDIIYHQVSLSITS